jgi:hypothetical protein
MMPLLAISLYLQTLINTGKTLNFELPPMIHKDARIFTWINQNKDEINIGVASRHSKRKAGSKRLSDEIYRLTR